MKCDCYSGFTTTTAAPTLFCLIKTKIFLIQMLNINKKYFPLLRTPKKQRFCLPWVIYLLFSSITGTMNHKTMLPDIFFSIKMARVQRNHFVSLWNWKIQKQSESMLRDNIFLHASLLQGKHFNTKKNSSLGWRVGGGEDEEMHSSWTEMCFYGPITGLSVILTEASKQTCQPSYEKWELPRPCLHLSFLSSQPKSAFAT